MPQPTPILPFGSYRPDVVDYEGINSQVITNVVRRGDGYGPFPDWQGLTASMPAPCRGAFTAQAPNGQEITFAGTSSKLYMLNNTNNSWTDVSRGGGTYGVLQSTAQWQFAQFNSLVFATQANDVLQVFTLGSSTAFANESGSPPQAAYIAIVGQFVVLLGLLNLPFRMQWSGIGDPTNWTAGVSQSDFQDFTDGGITQGAAGGEYGVIFQLRVIRQMTYAPGSSYVFQITRICEDQGLLVPYALARAESQIFFLSAQGWQQLAPGVLPIPIGKEKIDRSFLADWDSSQPQLLIGTNDPNSTRVCFAYKSVNGIANLMDTVLLYDYVLQDWTPIHGINNGAGIEYLFTASKSGQTLEALDQTFPVVTSITGATGQFGNLLLQSNTFSNVAWTNSNATLTSAVGPSPDGGNNAWQWQRNSAAGASSNQSLTKAASSIKYTFSIFVKPAPGQSGVGNLFLALQTGDGAGNNVGAIFNVLGAFFVSSYSNGTGFTALSSTVTAYPSPGGGWTRYSITITTNSTTTLQSSWSFNQNGVQAGGTDSASNTAAWAFGAQVEQLSGPTLYVPTTTAAVPIVGLTVPSITMPGLVPPVDTAFSPTALYTGEIIDIFGVGGTTEANGEGFTIFVVNSTTILLQGVPFVHAYTSGGSIAGSIDFISQQTSLDNVPFAGFPALAAFNSSSILGYFTGANLAAFLESSEHSAAGERLRCQGFRPITDASAMVGTLSTRESLQASRVYGTFYKLTSQGLIPARKSGRYMRARVQIPAGSEWTYATGVEPITSIDGKR